MGRAALAAAVALTVAAGCGKKADDREAPEEEAELVASLDGLDAMPASATAVIGVDVAALAASPLAHRAVEQLLLRDSALAGRVAELAESCELAPAEDVEHVLIGLLPGEGEAPAESVLVAHGRFAETTLVTCLGRMLGGGGGALTSRTVGGRTLYRASEQGAEGVWLGFGSGRTAVVASSEAALLAALGDGAKLSSRAEMVRLIGRAGVDGAAVWAAGLVDPQVGAGLVASTGGEVGAPRTIFGHLGLAEGLELFLGAELPSADDANKLVSLAKVQLEAAALVAQRHGLGRLVRRLETSADGETVSLSLSLSDPELAQLLSAIDMGPASIENPAPESGPEGDVEDGQRDAPPGDEAPAR